MTDIFTEVEEDLRRERAKRLWDRYGWMVTALLIAVVASTAGYQGWNWYQARERAAASDRYATAARGHATGENQSALTGFEELRRDAPAGYRLLSRFHEAGLRSRTGDRDAALSLWNDISSDSATPQPYRDLAALMAVLHDVNTGDPAALSARLAALDRPDGPFRFSARELLAALAERQGQRERAVTILRGLVEAPDAPVGMRERASEALGALASTTPAGS